MISFLNDPEIAGLRYFKADSINENALNKITRISKKIRRDILSMTINAGSGHIGGSMSSADVYMMLWLCANVTPDNFYDEVHDRIVISHGHTSPGVYAVLGNFGFFDIKEAVQGFRKKETMFEGHPSSNIPGVEWGSGSLGQGLSVGSGFALAAKLKKNNNRVFVVMGDGEQQKGQLIEAAAFAAKNKLNNLTAIIDVNGLQASGATDDIMPGNIWQKYESSGWEVISIDGHNYNEIYKALKFTHDTKPVMILANTVMSKGVSFIENNFEYHGKILSKQQYEDALIELGEHDEATHPGSPYGEPPLQGRGWAVPEKQINPGNFIQYKTDKPVECRTAAGEAIYDIIKNNPGAPIAVVDCDLMESVKTMKVLKDFPEQFIECGIQEHNAASVSGGLSKAGVIPFFLDFGVFGIDETYGQHRMNDVNGTSIKLITTHCGLDVGEDGKTHQCVDYISLISNLPGYKLIVPADANQTDRAVRYIASTPGNFVIAVGRSKVPVLSTRDNEAFYNDEYAYEYGKAEWIREGNDAVIIAIGTMLNKAVKAADELSAEDISVGVLNISSPGKIDVDDIRNACATGVVITYEDHFVQSGLGNIVASIIAENGFSSRFKKMGVSKYGKSCSADEQYPLQGLDVQAVKENIKKLINKKQTITIN
ncbi:MAG: transketolase [Chitinophagaceae bacterium]|nr:transketolase [Chitinophagaceae bacterium]